MVGNHYELYPDPLGNYERLFARHGPMIKTVNMGTTIYHTNAPEISRHILKEGEFFTKSTSHSSHPLFYLSDQDALFTCDTSSPSFEMSHKFVPPALSPRAMAHHIPLVRESARAIFPVFDEFEEKKVAFNVYQYMFKMAGQIVWRVMVGQDLQHFAKGANTPPGLPIRIFGEYLRRMKQMSLRPKWYGALPFGEPKKLKDVHDALWANIADQLAICSTPGTENEVLPLSDPTSSLRASCVADFLRRARDENGQALPKEVLLGNTVALLGAGFTTSSSMLSLILYALVKYPGNQERLLQELIDAGASPDKEWTYDELHSLKFMDCFVKETQRLHSPAYQTARNTLKDVVLPGGYLIPENSVVISCFPMVHTNPLHWDKPKTFDPDRWMDPQGEAHKASRKGLFTPFAAGRRGCVGFNLALTEVKMVLAEFIYNYHFEDASPEEVIYDPEFLVVRPINLYVSASKRTSWPEKSSA